METMTDYNIDPVQAELNRTKAELQLVRERFHNLKENLQSDLSEWANDNLDDGEPHYQELSELMQNNGLEGLKRTFTVIATLTYTFEVEIKAADRDAARDEVDNDIQTHISENLDVYYYDDVDLEVREA
jgi:hypothetical protein